MNSLETFRGLKEDKTKERILDAARSCVLRDGLKLTITAISREANISRPTIYSRYKNTDKLIMDVLDREIISLIEFAELPSTLEELVLLIVNTTAKARTNDLLQLIIRVAPQLLLTYHFVRLGHSQMQVIDLLTFLIMRTEGIRAEDPRRLAVFVLLAVQASAVSGELTHSLIDDDTWRVEFTHLLEGYLK